MTKAARYGAFISYSHAASADVASGLQKWLETCAKPWWRPRAIDVFRDQQILPRPVLWSRIADALDQSSHFILLASPEAAQSKWIKREIRYLVRRLERERPEWPRPRRAHVKSKSGTLATC